MESRLEGRCGKKNGSRLPSRLSGGFVSVTVTDGRCLGSLLAATIACLCCKMIE